MTVNERLAWLLTEPIEKRREYLETLTFAEREELATHWQLWARAEQLAPDSAWRIWLIMAGRGFGKTRAGSEWVRSVSADPQARIALVGTSLGEARAVMVEGDSGLLAVSPPRRRPHFEPSLRRLTWPNGAIATLYSAMEPESLRGPQHSHFRWSVAKGIIRQRSARPHRCFGSLRSRGDCLAATHRSRTRRNLADWRDTERRLGRSRTRDW